MKRFIFGFLVLAVAGAAHADDSKVEAVLRERLAMIDRAKVEAEVIIEAMRKGQIRPRQKEARAMGMVGKSPKFGFKSKEDREEAIAEWEKKTTDEALAAKAAPPLQIENVMRVGDFGYLPDHVVDTADGQKSWQFKIQQVVDDNNMLVKVTQYNHTRRGQSGDSLIWMVGRYSNAVDGQVAKFNGVFRVTGTKQYATALGSSKTVYQIEKFDIAPIVERLKAEAAAKQPDKTEPAATEEWREWSDATGQFKLTARLISVTDGKVKLEKQDGSVANVPVDKLSEADQKVVAQFEPPAT